MKKKAKEPAPMRVRVSYTETLSGKSLAAFARYNNIDVHKRREIREALIGSLKDLGSMGVDEQISSGAVSLEADELREHDETDDESDGG